MIIQAFFSNEVIIRMLKILKMNQNLNKMKFLPIKMKIVNQNHLIKDLNKNKLIKLNKKKKIWLKKKVNQTKNEKKIKLILKVKKNKVFIAKQ